METLTIKQPKKSENKKNETSDALSKKDWKEFDFIFKNVKK